MCQDAPYPLQAETAVDPSQPGGGVIGVSTTNPTVLPLPSIGSPTYPPSTAFHS